MSWDTYLKAHSGRDVFDHDSDHVIAWSKRSVPLAWLMFFKTDDLGTAPEEPPDLTTERKAACDLYIARLAASRPALETAVGDTDAFDLLGGYVKSCDLPFLSLTTWEVWIGHGGEPDEWRANFLRALATAEKGPSSESWEWALDCAAAARQDTAMPFSAAIHPGGPGSTPTDTKDPGKWRWSPKSCSGPFQAPKGSCDTLCPRVGTRSRQTRSRPTRAP